MSDQISNEPPEKPVQAKGWRKHATILGGCAGLGLCGCVVPAILLMLSAVFLDDVGGPLLWPLVAVGLGIVGMAIGLLLGALLPVSGK